VSWLLATTLRMCKNYPDDCHQLNGGGIADGRRRSSQRNSTSSTAANQLELNRRRGGGSALQRRTAAAASVSSSQPPDLFDARREGRLIAVRRWPGSLLRRLETSRSAAWRPQH
jgi:hypothetical protein